MRTKSWCRNRRTATSRGRPRNSAPSSLCGMAAGHRHRMDPTRSRSHVRCRDARSATRMSTESSTTRRTAIKRMASECCTIVCCQYRAYLILFFILSRIRKAFKCNCGKSYKTSQKLKNHTLLVHSTGSTSDLSLSSSMSSLNSTQQLSDSASPPLAITSLKNSINLVTLKSKGVAGSSKNGKGESNKIPKLTPMKGYDTLGILTPATSPKNQAQQQQQQQSIDSSQMLNGSSNGSLLGSSVENLQSIPLTPVSPAASPSSSTASSTGYQQLKKGDS